MNDYAEVITEFIDFIPEHIEHFPAFSSNGVTRKEREWRYMCVAMAKEIVSLRAGDKWQPLETAPKDGTVILTYGDVPAGIRVAYYDKNILSWDYYPYGSGRHLIQNPTHWQPLPEGPKQ